jgi:hypothetical protein
MKVANVKLRDVAAAFKAIPGDGSVVVIRGKVKASGGYSHVQGVAALPSHYVVTHSDENRESGRLLLANRYGQSKGLVAWFAIPPFREPAEEPFYHHAGGCQLVGDCLIVPCETGQHAPQSSFVAFVDLTDPIRPREIETLRIERKIRGMAAGLTNFTRSGQEVWLAAVYEHGRIDFYESTTLETPAPFVFLNYTNLKEENHQAFVLLTQKGDGTDQLFAVGLSTGGGYGKNVAVLYRLTLDNAGKWALTPLDEATFKTKGAKLRWGSTLEIVSDQKLVLHCASQHFDGDFTLNVFDVDTPAALRVTARVSRKRASKPGTRAGSARRARSRRSTSSRKTRR